MISLSATTGGVRFIFENSSYYLYGNGAIDTPVNSLLLVDDGSDAVIFKKIDGDVFVSAPVAEFGLSKSEIEAFYKENMVGSTGGGGVTSGEVETMIDASISGKADTSAVTAVNDVLTSHVGNTAIHVTAGDKLTWDNKQDALTAGTGIDITNDVISCTVTGGGNNVIELTQAQYDALVDKDPDAFYIITDAPAIDLSGYAQTSAVTAEITAAVSGKQDTLSAGTGIDITNNVISATGGGSTYSAGTNIDITNDTINCTLPIGMTSGYKSIKSDRASVSGDRNIAWGLNAYVGALGSSYTPDDAFAFGGNVKVYNTYEAAFGRYNSSVQDTHSGGDSGTTLFSVGNGTSSARHNAFEIRQNGDIYISKDGQDVKLQDQLGGGGVNVVQTTGASTTDVMSQNAVTTQLNGYVKSIVPDTDESYERFYRFSTPNNYNYFLLRNAKINGRQVLNSGYSTAINQFNLVETSAITTSVTSASTDSEIPTAKAVYDVIPSTTSAVTSGSTSAITSGAVYDQLDGLKLKKVTQAEYDALVSGGTVDNNTLYVIS